LVVVQVGSVSVVVRLILPLRQFVRNATALAGLSSLLFALLLELTLLACPVAHESSPVEFKVINGECGDEVAPTLMECSR
jgi:hypothetical protein